METSDARPLIDSDLYSGKWFSYRDDWSPGGMVWAGDCGRVLSPVRRLVAVHGEFGSVDYGDVGIVQDRNDE